MWIGCSQHRAPAPAGARRLRPAPCEGRLKRPRRALGLGSSARPGAAPPPGRSPRRPPRLWHGRMKAGCAEPNSQACADRLPCAVPPLSAPPASATSDRCTSRPPLALPYSPGSACVSGARPEIVCPVWSGTLPGLYPAAVTGLCRGAFIQRVFGDCSSLKSQWIMLYSGLVVALKPKQGPTGSPPGTTPTD